MQDSVHVKGLSDLQKFLDTFTAKLEANIMRGALRAGMNVIKPVAQSNVHSVSGELAASMKVSTRRRGGRVSASLRASDVQDYKAIWVEYGTRPHFISVQESEKPINARASFASGTIVRASMTTVNRNVLKIGARFVGPTVHHPGAKPHPYMRPALDAMATPAVIAAAEYIKQRLATKEGLDTSGVNIEGDVP